MRGRPSEGGERVVVKEYTPDVTYLERGTWKTLEQRTIR